MSQLPKSLVGTQLERLFLEETRIRKEAIANGETKYDVESTYFPGDPGDADVVVGSAVGPNTAREFALNRKRRQ